MRRRQATQKKKEGRTQTEVPNQGMEEDKRKESKSNSDKKRKEEGEKSRGEGQVERDNDDANVEMGEKGEEKMTNKDEEDGLVLTGPTITKLVLRRNTEGLTLLQNETLSAQSYTMILSLIFSVVNTEPELIPEVMREMIRTENWHIMKKLEKGDILSGPPITAMITHKNADGKTVLQDDSVSDQRMVLSMLSLAVGVLNDELSLIAQVTRVLMNEENAFLLEALKPQLTRMFSHRRSNGKTLLEALYNVPEGLFPAQKQRKKKAQYSYRNLLYTAILLLNISHENEDLVSEVAKQLAKAENVQLLEDVKKDKILEAGKLKKLESSVLEIHRRYRP